MLTNYKRLLEWRDIAHGRHSKMCSNSQWRSVQVTWLKCQQYGVAMKCHWWTLCMHRKQLYRNLVGSLLTRRQQQHATFHAACFRLWLLITVRSLETCSEAGISSDMAHNYSEQVGLHEKTHAFLFPTPGPKCADVPLRNYSLTLPAQYNCCNKIMSCKHKHCQHLPSITQWPLACTSLWWCRVCCRIWNQQQPSSFTSHRTNNCVGWQSK